MSKTSGSFVLLFVGFLAATVMTTSCSHGNGHPSDAGSDSVGAGGASGGAGSGGGGMAGSAGGQSGAAGGSAGTVGGTAGSAGGTAGSAGGAAGSVGGTAGAAGATTGGAGGTAGTAGGSAGTGGTASYFYHFTVDGCDTGRLTFSSLADMCAGLQSASLNHNCALAARQEFFQEECSGTFQEAP